MKDVYIRNNNSQIRQVNILKNNAGFILDWHLHDFYHANYITNGYVDVLTEQARYRVNAGELFIMPPYVKHRLESIDGYEQIGMDIHNEFDTFGLFSLIDEAYNKTFSIVKMNHILSMFENLNINKGQMNNLEKMQFYNFMEDILYEALRMHENNNSFKDKISKINGYSLSVTELAEKLFMSKSSLEREMRKNLGMSAKEFLDKNRMTKAYYLLLETDKKINDISDELGFCDTPHFVTFFKRKEGVTPLAFRKRERII